MAALASATSSGVKTPRTIKNPFKSNKYRSSSVISIGNSIFGAEIEVEILVALFSRVVVVLSVDWSRVCVVEPPVAEPVTDTESARKALAAVPVKVVETKALLLLGDAKANARTAGVS